MRLVGVGALIALVAVAAATFATVRATTVAVREAQQDSLHADAVVYDELVGYAATHRSWSGAGPLVRRLAREGDRAVTVTDETGRVLVTSSGTAAADPGDARARLDPLDVDPVLLAGADDGADEPTDAGPVACPRGACRFAPIAPTGLVDARVPVRDPLPATGPSEQLAVAGPVRAWRRTVRGLDACLDRAGLPPAAGLTERFEVLGGRELARRPVAVAACATEARRSWYADRVAPPALLLVSGDAGSADVF